MPFANAYAGRRVLLTGHTGFKGAWLAHWLLELGAEVYGLAMAPEPCGAQTPLFDDLGLADRLDHAVVDVRDAQGVEARVRAARPDIVFHLAAQPLVRLSYAEPVATFATNVQGTVHLLDAVRRAGRRMAVVVVTTDKCYENTGRTGGYREDDPMGGHDPYSASKGAAELVVASYRRSFFHRLEGGISLSSARAGNVIGGGDWAADRIVPDCVRALAAGRTVEVRNPHATRPWQHVLEPLSGYLTLGAAQWRALQGGDAAAFARLGTAFNFGPQVQSNRDVGALVEAALRAWPGTWRVAGEADAPHEASLLALAIDKAHHQLGWQPVWDFEATVARTMHWYRRRLAGEPSGALTSADLHDYIAAARTLGLPWTT